MIGIVLGILLAAGFGTCGVMWLKITAGNPNGGSSSDLTMLFGMAGLAIAAVLAGGVYLLARKRSPNTDRTPEQ
jgi:uncharacterized membrane protein YciS (DUF1049 family)